MKSYDKAYDLANDMKNSEVYKQYCELKDKAFADEMNRDLYKQYKQLSMNVNAAVMAGQEPDEETKQKFQQLTSLLALNADVSAFMLAEHRLNQMIGDVFKIIADAVEIDLGFLQE